MVIAKSERFYPRYSFADNLSPDQRYRYSIPVAQFIEYFQPPEIIREALETYPTLCYLLGKVTPQPHKLMRITDGETVEKHLLVEGSGMFGLENRLDALEWKGIFNHGVGSARHTWYLFNRLKNLSQEQRQKFIEAGFDFSEFDQLDAESLRDFMLMNHLTRRQWDERRWYGLDDEFHPKTNIPGETAYALLEKYKAPQIFQDLIRVENHPNHLAQAASDGPHGRIFSNIVDALLTYADWTFEQSPMTLVERFKKLGETRKDIEPKLLDILESCANVFQAVVNEALETDTFEKLRRVDPYNWELEIRKAYCIPSGLTLDEAFPGYLQQFPQVE